MKIGAINMTKLVGYSFDSENVHFYVYYGIFLDNSKKLNSLEAFINITFLKSSSSQATWLFIRIEKTSYLVDKL